MPQAQQVLSGDDGGVRRGGQGASHQAPVAALALGEFQVVHGEGPVLRGEAFQPAQGGVVVVGAHIAHAVSAVVMGQIVALHAPAVKGHLQDLHAGEASLPEKLPHRVGKIAQVLGDDGLLSQSPLHRPEELHPGPLPPVAVPGGGRLGRDDVVGVEPPEVVDPQHIIEALLPADALDPPGVAVGLHPLPVEEGVAPQLAVGGEAVRRDAGHLHGPHVPVQLELSGPGPHVGGVAGDIDGQVPDKADAQAVGVVLQGGPLAEEEVLDPLPEVHRVRQAGPGGVHGGRLPPAEGIGPLLPGAAAVFLLQRHEEGVVRQPGPVAGEEVPVVRRGRLQQPLDRPAQHAVPLAVEEAEVHLPGVVPPGQGGVLLPLQQAVRRQIVQIDEVGIAREGGKALIGRVAEAGRPDGQDLPPGLSRRGEKVREISGRLPHGPHAIGGGEAGQVHQYAAGPHRSSILPFMCRTLSPRVREKGMISWTASCSPASCASRISTPRRAIWSAPCRMVVSRGVQ